jgi:hypothetical protein
MQMVRYLCTRLKKEKYYLVEKTFIENKLFLFVIHTSSFNWKYLLQDSAVTVRSYCNFRNICISLSKLFILKIADAKFKIYISYFFLFPFLHSNCNFSAKIINIEVLFAKENEV